MKNRQENLATLTISSHNVTTSTREPTTRAWISADIWRQDGAICSKNRNIVPYHGSARIPGLTVSIPDYGSCCETGSLGILSFQTRLLYQRKLSRDNAKEASRGTRSHLVPVEDSRMWSLHWTTPRVQDAGKIWFNLLKRKAITPCDFQSWWEGYVACCI